MKVTIGLLVMLLVIGVAGTAQDAWAQNAGSKLLRGVANIATGWIEIPKQMYQTSVDHNPLLGLTWGTVKGVGYGVGRTLVGVYDTVTFPIPIPSDYEPVVEPEYVFSPESDY
ncbi:exosortase system-associated protein, TIGR04073 family [PVC group bacterium]|nr:exosortase system-associated protein, TIGR04073 family [PVC group bacterium]